MNTQSLKEKDNAEKIINDLIDKEATVLVCPFRNSNKTAEAYIASYEYYRGNLLVYLGVPNESISIIVDLEVLLYAIKNGITIEQADKEIHANER